jgi:SAM-dependent methyltransferase
MWDRFAGSHDTQLRASGPSPEYPFWNDRPLSAQRADQPDDAGAATRVSELNPGAQALRDVSDANETCPCCGGNSDVIENFPRDRIRRRLSALLGNDTINQCAFGNYHLRQCRICGLEFSDPMVEPSAEFYSWLTNSQKNLPAERWEWRECQRQLQASSVNWTTDKLRVIVDVGCRDGRFLRILEELDGVRVIGVDINCEAVEGCRAQGLEALCGTFSTVRRHLPDDVHVITLWHVIEHVADPVGLLLEAAELLTDHGRIYFSVPLSPQSYEKSWPDPLNAPPHHLTRWTVPALQALATRLDMPMQLILPDADPFWFRVVRSLTLQAVSPYSRLGRGGKLWRLLAFLSKHPWQPVVEIGRQARHPRIDSRVRPDVVMVCLRKSMS